MPREKKPVPKPEKITAGQNDYYYGFKYSAAVNAGTILIKKVLTDEVIHP
jgi:hypothetical protein